MSSKKEIQGRIKSVKNTKKVTRAMEMVAAAKMRRATEAVLKTREYAKTSWESILRLAKSVDFEHPLLIANPEAEEKTAVILFSSNRGLCGGFNSNILKKTLSFLRQDNKKTDLVLVGKKGISVHKQYNSDVIAEFPKPDIASGINDVIPAAQMMIQDYLAGKYQKIIIAYTDFVNSQNQVPRLKQILPVDIGAEEKSLGNVSGQKEKLDFSENGIRSLYIFEPSAGEVLDKMVPRFIEIQLFQALLESNASEHSARMSAMHQATDAANDMISELTLSYNKARQASITQEIAEIGAGVNAMA